MFWVCFMGLTSISPAQGEWYAAAGRYSALFAAFVIRSQKYFYPANEQNWSQLGLTSGNIWRASTTSGSNVFAQWALGVQISLEEGVALYLFPVEMAASPRGTGLALESYHTMWEELEQERAAPGVTEIHHNAGRRKTASAKHPEPPGQGLRPRRQKARGGGGAVPNPSNKGGRVSRQSKEGRLR